MASEEWQQCANWLVRCKILPEDHRATLPDAAAFDLAQALRDGVLICHLLNNLSPGAVDLKDFSPRPQLSQVRFPSLKTNGCGKNNEFLHYVHSVWYCSYMCHPKQG